MKICKHCGCEEIYPGYFEDCGDICPLCKLDEFIDTEDSDSEEESG